MNSVSMQGFAHWPTERPLFLENRFHSNTQTSSPRMSTHDLLQNQGLFVVGDRVYDLQINMQVLAIDLGLLADS